MSKSKERWPVRTLTWVDIDAQALDWRSWDSEDREIRAIDPDLLDALPKRFRKALHRVLEATEPTCARPRCQSPIREILFRLDEDTQGDPGEEYYEMLDQWYTHPVQFTLVDTGKGVIAVCGACSPTHFTRHRPAGDVDSDGSRSGSWPGLHG